MFNVQVTTPAADYLEAEDLRNHLRLNDQGEDEQLEEFLAAAVERWEADTGRPILTTSYRQYLERWPCEILLGRGGVTAVSAVKRFTDGAGAVENVVSLVDLSTNPPRVILRERPSLITNASGITVSPVGYVDFTAGWANAAAVPKAVKIAVLMLAGHWYGKREEFGTETLQRVPEGFQRIAANYRTGLSGQWGE